VRKRHPNALQKAVFRNAKGHISDWKQSLCINFGNRKNAGTLQPEYKFQGVKTLRFNTPLIPADKKLLQTRRLLIF